MVEAADWDRVLVADLAVERARLSNANVVRFGGSAAADDAGSRRDEFAVLLVAQTDGLRLKAASDDFRCRSWPLRTVEGSALLLVFVARVADRLRYPSAHLSFLDCGEPLPEVGFDSFGIGGRQGVLSREVFLDPVGSLVG